jgi:predicted secreted protein
MAFHAGNGILLKSTTTTLDEIRNIDLSIDNSVVDVSSMTDANWKALLAGKRDASVSVEGLIDWQNADNAGVVLIGAWDAGTELSVVVERSATASANEFQKITMSMLVESVDIDFADGEAVSYSANLMLSSGTPTVAEGT